MHKLICSVGMMIVALLAGALGARGQGPVGPPIVWQFDSARALTELPSTPFHAWLSVDGRRLYFQSDDFYAVERPAVGQRFGPSQRVRGVTTGISQMVPIGAYYTDDERTVRYGGLLPNGCTFFEFQAQRPHDTAAFAAPQHLKTNFSTACVSQDDAWLEYFQLTPNGQQAIATFFEIDNYSYLLELRRVRADSFAVVRLSNCCAREDRIRPTSSQLLNNGLQLLVAGNYALPQPGVGLFLLSRASLADTFGLPQPIQLPVLQGITPLDIAEAHYRPDIGVLIVGINKYRPNGTLGGIEFWLLEGQSRPQGVTSGATQSSFGLAPNPAHHTVRLTGLPPTATTAHIIDALGRTVQTSDLAPLTSTLSLTGLPPGLYTVRVGAATRRLVVE